MEKDIAPYLSEDDRKNYVNTLLFLSLDRKDLIDPEITLHSIGKLYGSKHFPVDWTYYDSFTVKRKSPVGKIICVFSTRKPQLQGHLALASIGVHDPAYLVDEKKLKYRDFGHPNTEKVEQEKKRLDEKMRQTREKEKQKKQRMNDWNKPLGNLGEMWRQKKK